MICLFSCPFLFPIHQSIHFISSDFTLLATLVVVHANFPRHNDYGIIYSLLNYCWLVLRSLSLSGSCISSLIHPSIYPLVKYFNCVFLYPFIPFFQYYPGRNRPFRRCLFLFQSSPPPPSPPLPPSSAPSLVWFSVMKKGLKTLCRWVLPCPVH